MEAAGNRSAIPGVYGRCTHFKASCVSVFKRSLCAGWELVSICGPGELVVQGSLWSRGACGPGVLVFICGPGELVFICGPGEVVCLTDMFRGIEG